jgi:hypothetical protein
MSTYDDARAMYPEIGSLTDDQMSPWLPVAQAMVSASWYGDTYGPALAMALAHRVIRAFAASGGVSGGGTIGGGAAGPVTSASNRAASVGYAGPLGAGAAGATSGADVDLMTTTAGQALRALRDSRAGNCPAVFI